MSPSSSIKTHVNTNLCIDHHNFVYVDQMSKINGCKMDHEWVYTQGQIVGPCNTDSTLNYSVTCKIILGKLYIIHYIQKNLKHRAWFAFLCTLRILDPPTEGGWTCIAGVGSSKERVLRVQWSLGHIDFMKVVPWCFDSNERPVSNPLAKSVLWSGQCFFKLQRVGQCSKSRNEKKNPGWLGYPYMLHGTGIFTYIYHQFRPNVVNNTCMEYLGYIGVGWVI